MPVKPYTTKVITLGVGQRTDILVKANGKPTDAVFMRSDISLKCTGSSQPHAYAAIFYEKANRKVLPTTPATPYDDSICGNVSLLMSFSTDIPVQTSSASNSSNLLLRILSRRPNPYTNITPPVYQ